jgi:hypothetical protein
MVGQLEPFDSVRTIPIHDKSQRAVDRMAHGHQLIVLAVPGERGCPFSD